MSDQNHRETHRYSDFAADYARLGISGTYAIAYQELAQLIRTKVSGDQAVDHCCGTGRSTRFITSLGFHTIGIDRTEEMVAEATRIDPHGTYKVAPANTLDGIADNSVDLVVQSIAMMEYSSVTQMIESLKEYRRVLRNNQSRVILVVATEASYQGQWESFNNDWPENARLQSGEKGRIVVRDSSVQFFDYYWTDADYRSAITTAGLSVIEAREPIGTNKAAPAQQNQTILDSSRPYWRLYLCHSNEYSSL